ncbi:MAG: SMC-Scp complex subunit ScpB, partial [Saprospiraceae bacterium]|nr:SMC-Scp complex subunit ScpB [Saprospiraceae bacterium]
MEGLLRHIESLIFVADQPVSLEEIQETLETAFELRLKQEDLLIDINLLINQYADDKYSMEIIEIAG